MASRRSRLQVKPNIGGPKVGGAKPPPRLKIPDGSSKKVEVGPGSPLKSPRATSPIKSPRVTSPVKSPRVPSPIKSPRVTTPLKSPRVAYPIRGTSEKVASPVKDDQISSQAVMHNEAFDQKHDNQKDSQRKSDSQDNNKRDRETSEDSASTTEQSAQPPKRARLRRFGTVNVGLARGAKTNVQQTEEKMSGKDGVKVREDVNQADEISQDDLSESLKKIGSTKIDSDQSNELATEQAEAVKTDVVEDKTADKELNKARPKPSDRARLPKAKPNFQAANRRRPRPREDNSADGTSNGQDSSASQLSPTSNTEKTPAGSRASEDTSTSPVKCTVPKSPQKSYTAHPLQSSPVKTGGKQSGDKDRWAKQRTVSVSEPQAPPPKKVRTPKVDAPVDKPPDRGKMRMRDLIYWNPSSNPMKPKEKQTVEVKDKENKVIEKENTVEKAAIEEPEFEETMPVPQVTIGPDGNIVINEQSLVVKNTLEDKGPSQDDEPIDETEMFTTYGSFKKNQRSRRWSEKETARFYKALAMVGIDFFLIQKMIPSRKRFELKKKFKKEERTNGHLIEKVLNERLQFDESVFENVSEDELEEKEKKKKEQQEKREQKKKEREEKRKETMAKKKKPNLRMRICKNPYEPDESSSDSEAEKELEKNFRENPDVVETGKENVSKTGKDTEVVNILMDMSEGRLQRGAEGETVSEKNGTGVQPPVEVMNQSYSDDTVMLIPQTSRQVYLNDNNDSLRQSIPGIQNIITIEAQSLCPQDLEASLTGNDIRAVAEGQTSNVVVQNSYPPYQVIRQPLETSASVSSQTVVHNGVNYISILNSGQYISQATNTAIETSENQIYSVANPNDSNETYIAVSAEQVENLSYENQEVVKKTGNKAYAAHQEVEATERNSENSATEKASEGSSAAETAQKGMSPSGKVETARRRIVKTANGDIVEIEIINDELEAVKTEQTDPELEAQIIESDMPGKSVQAAESTMQALKSKVQASQSTPRKYSSPIFQSPPLPKRSPSQSLLQKNTRSPMRAAPSLLQASPNQVQSIQSQVQASRSPGPSASNTIQTPKSPVESSVPLANAQTFNGNQIISQQILSPQSASRFPGLPQAGPNDQYVLVTVMPESGEETIIHVYRLHGNLQQ